VYSGNGKRGERRRIKKVDNLQELESSFGANHKLFHNHILDNRGALGERWALKSEKKD